MEILIRGEKIEVTKAIQDYAKEMELRTESELKKDELNYKQVDMLNFINAHPKIKDEAKKADFTHNNEITIHVVESTNDIVTTEDKLDHVEASMIKDGQAEVTSQLDQKDEETRALDIQKLLLILM